MLELQLQQINVELMKSADGSVALNEVRELRDRVWPLFSQGADANKQMIDKVAKLPD
jgi:hypothetical protein